MRMTSSSVPSRLPCSLITACFFSGSHLSFFRLEPKSLSVGFSLDCDCANVLVDRTTTTKNRKQDRMYSTFDMVHNFDPIRYQLQRACARHRGKRRRREKNLRRDGGQPRACDYV